MGSPFSHEVYVAFTGITYRGAQPDRIESIWGEYDAAGARVYRVRTNAGEVYALAPSRVLPSLGDDVAAAPARYQSDKRRSRNPGFNARTVQAAADAARWAEENVAFGRVAATDPAPEPGFHVFTFDDGDTEPQPLGEVSAAALGDVLGAVFGDYRDDVTRTAAPYTFTRDDAGGGFICRTSDGADVYIQPGDDMREFEESTLYASGDVNPAVAAAKF